jgi:hypothetical protein
MRGERELYYNVMYNPESMERSSKYERRLKVYAVQ